LQQEFWKNEEDKLIKFDFIKEFQLACIAFVLMKIFSPVLVKITETYDSAGFDESGFPNLMSPLIRRI
jgi:hypothetical protein